MTLCPACAAKYGPAIRFAAVIIDAELGTRRTSQASADLKAMLPKPPVGLDEFHPDTTHNPKDAA